MYGVDGQVCYGMKLAAKVAIDEIRKRMEESPDNKEFPEMISDIESSVKAIDTYCECGSSDISIPTGYYIKHWWKPSQG